MRAEEPIPVDSPGIVKPIPHCEPPAPKLPQTQTRRIIAEWVIDSSGKPKDVVVKSNDDRVSLYYRLWVLKCRYTPASKDGRPVAVRIKAILRLDSPSEAEQPWVMGPSGPRPEPRCDLSTLDHPPGVTGLVLVEFVVEPDGRVTDIRLKNKNAPAVLFEAVRRWLEGCSYTPTRDAQSRRNVRVKTIVPYHFH